MPIYRTADGRTHTSVVNAPSSPGSATMDDGVIRAASPRRTHLGCALRDALDPAPAVGLRGALLPAHSLGQGVRVATLSADRRVGGAPLRKRRRGRAGVLRRRELARSG